MFMFCDMKAIFTEMLDYIYLKKCKNIEKNKVNYFSETCDKFLFV